MLVIGVAAVANYMRFIAKTSAPHKRSNKLVSQFVFHEWNVKDLANKTLEIEIHLTVCWYKIKFKMYLTQTGGSLMYSCLFFIYFYFCLTQVGKPCVFRWKSSHIHRKWFIFWFIKPYRTTFPLTKYVNNILLVLAHLFGILKPNDKT